MYRYVAVIFLVLGNHRLLVHASGNIGCLFSDTLCEQDREWCFDDYAFGRCLPLYGHVKEDDLHRYELGTQELHLLEQEMQRLFLLGYRWSHTYTQCVLQALLTTIRFRKSFDVTSCNGDLDQDLEGALKAIEGEELDHIDPRDLAIVRFTPSETDPHAPYADEVYFPPVEHNELPHNPQHQQQEPSEANAGASSGSTHAGVSGASASPPAESSAHQDLPPHDSPHHDPPPHNYVNYYGNGADYEDMDVYPYSPHQYSPPLNPVYRKRSDFSNQEISPEQIAKVAAILDEIRNKGPLSLPEKIDTEETVFFPERLLEKNEDEEDEEDEGVFGEAPAKPMYTEGGQLFVPEIEGENPEESVWSKFSRLHEPWIQVGMPNQDPLIAEPSVKEALLPLLSQNEPLPRHFFTEPDDNSINSLLMQEDPSLDLEDNSEIGPFDQMLMQEELARVQEPSNLKKLQAVFGPQLSALSDYDTEYEYPDYGLMKGNDYQYYDYGANSKDNDAHIFVKKDEETAALDDQLALQVLIKNDRSVVNDHLKLMDITIIFLTILISPLNGGLPRYMAIVPISLSSFFKSVQAQGDSLDLLTQAAWSFQRPERLDVKKPGPFYENSKNNFAFNYEDPVNEDDLEQVGEAIVDVQNGGSSGNALLDRLLEEHQGNNLMPQPKIRAQQTFGDVLLAEEGLVDDTEKVPFAQPFKQPQPPPEKEAKSDVAPGKVEIADSSAPAPTSAPTAAAHSAAPTHAPSYVYIITHDSVTEAQAKEMVGLILKDAGLPEKYVDHLNWEDRQVTFHVQKNPKGVSAADVAKKAEELRDVIKKELEGVEITKAGLGDQATTALII
ncbi:unnamed protein product, partial [Meganyctiphanes norvegica]